MDPTAVVAVAGFAGTTAAAVLAYRAGVATAREETERLREQHREDERRNRQGTYHQLLALINALMWADRKSIDQLMERWYFLSAGVALFGATAVVEKVRPLSAVLAEGATAHDRDEWRNRVVAAARELANAMREDIGVAELTPPGPLG